MGLPPVLKSALSLLGRRSTDLYLKWCKLHPSFGKIPLPSHRIRILPSSTIRAITDSTPKFWTSQGSYYPGRWVEMARLLRKHLGFVTSSPALPPDEVCHLLWGRHTPHSSWDPPGAICWTKRTGLHLRVQDLNPQKGRDTISSMQHNLQKLPCPHRRWCSKARSSTLFSLLHWLCRSSPGAQAAGSNVMPFLTTEPSPSRC